MGWSDLARRFDVLAGLTELINRGVIWYSQCIKEELRFMPQPEQLIARGVWESEATEWFLVATTELPDEARCASGAGIVIVDSGHDEASVLLARKGDEETWRVPGGHKEPGETSYQAFLREAEEEVGVLEWEIDTANEATVATIAGRGIYAACWTFPHEPGTEAPINRHTGKPYRIPGCTPFYYKRARPPFAEPREGLEIVERRLFRPNQLPPMRPLDEAIVIEGVRFYVERVRG